MFLVQLESLVDGYEGGFYPHSFTINLQGICNNEIENKYKYMFNSVLITKDELKRGKEISKDRKKILYRVYKRYGKINEHKLNEMLHNYDSPLCMDKNPYMLAYIMKHNITFKDERLQDWYVRFLDEFED